MKIINCFKPKSGMTLLEIIVALAIFAIINVGFYGVFSTVFINMYRTSQITESAFLSQQAIENRIVDVKTKLKNGLGDQVTDNRISLTLFDGSNQRSVYAYNLDETMINGKLVETLVAENRPPQLQVPVITSDIVIATYRGSNIDKYPNIASRTNLAINLVGGTPTVDNEGILIQHLYYWYISQPGYYTLAQPPIFPDQYEILAGYTAKDIVTIPESFGGRFLKLVVTPVGEKGAMGDSVISNDLFISALPVYTTLLLHYDASWIDRNNVAEYTTDRVQRWLDISPFRSASASPSGSLPTLTTHEFDQEVIKRTFGVGRSSSTGNQVLVTSSNSSIAAKQNVTVYFVANFASENGTDKNITILNSRSNSSTNKFILKTSNVTDSEGRLELIRYFNSGSSNVIAAANYRTDQWEIIKLELYTNQLAIRNGVAVNENVYSFVNSELRTISNTNTMTMTPFTMNFAAGYIIGEVLIYDGVVSSTDEQLILKYLAQKFLP
jgi:prepilin-type N-terminal cleavage/methylation domain-containing protein